MSEFVSNPLFGLALSILAYLVGMLIYRRFPHPLTTPLLLSAVFIIIFLKVTGISYQDYYQGHSRQTLQFFCDSHCHGGCY